MGLKQDEGGVDATLLCNGREESLRVRYLIGAVGAKGDLSLAYIFCMPS